MPALSPPIPVATSASEWIADHSLALVATPTKPKPALAAFGAASVG
jgi:hypothetical protein